MESQTPEQGGSQAGGGVSRLSTRLSIRETTPLGCSTRLRKRTSSKNVSYRDVDETIEPVDLGPTIEERRQEVAERYYSEVKEKALALLAARQAGLKRLNSEEADDAVRATTGMEGERLPTIEERRDDEQLSKQGTNQTDSVADEELKELENDTVQPSEQQDGLFSQTRDTEVEALEEDAAVDGIIEEDADEVQEPPELSQELVQALHEAVWEGDIDLVDDILDLPGATVDVLWFGENLLMTAIRAGQAEVAAFLIENGVNINHEVARIERKDDLQVEIDAKKAAYEQEQEELKAKKKKTKKKDKEKEALEQLEKEKEDEVKTPEAKISNTLTDFDCYVSTCRMMAVEFNQDEITEFIDEETGELWPEAFVPRKPRQKQKKKDMLEKLKQREDWVLSEEEILEPEVEPEEEKKEKVKTKKKTLSRRNTDSERTSRQAHRTGNSTMQSIEKDVTLNLSSERPVNGGLPEGLNIAGDDSSLFITPSPQNTPVPAIHHSVEVRSPETKFVYRGTKAFLIRQSANLKYKELSLEIPKQMPKREYVKSRGSFMAERDSWSSTKIDLSAQSSHRRNPKPKQMALHSRSSTNIHDDPERYQRLRSNTRKLSPWEDDNPETLISMFRRSKTQTYPSRAEADINKAKLSKENTLVLSDKTLGRSLSNSSLRSVSSFAFVEKRTRPETKKVDTSKTVSDRKLGRSSSSHVLKRYKSDIIRTDQPPQTSPSKLPLRNILSTSMRDLNSSKQYNNFSNVRANSWIEKKSPVNVVQNYYRSKRYSPAGYLKGGHPKDEPDNQLSLYEKRNNKTLAVQQAVVMA